MPSAAFGPNVTLRTQMEVAEPNQVQDGRGNTRRDRRQTPPEWSLIDRLRSCSGSQVLIANTNPRGRVPSLDLLHHRLGDVRNQRRAHFHFVNFFQPYLVRAHVPRGHGHDLSSKPVNRACPFLY